MTKLILNNITSPSFNLALEEYLLDNFKDDNIIMLWRNSKSVIIGKNQNAYGEIDIDYVKQNDISVIRRLTGGGAVFHDLGNINYTFISDYDKESFGDFTAFAAPICSFLKTKGVSASLSGRNDITVNNAKISGTAQTVKGTRCLAHGTLLYSADLTNLSKALKPNLKKLEDKAIRSVKSRVSNIKEISNISLSSEDFLNELYKFFLTQENVKEYTLTQEDIKAAKQIESERYSKWEWNFAFSPDFSLETEKKYPFGIVECKLNVEDGRIAKIKFFGDFFSVKNTDALEKSLINVKFDRNELNNVIKDIEISDYIAKMEKNMLVDLIMSAK